MDSQYLIEQDPFFDTRERLIVEEKLIHVYPENLEKKLWKDKMSLIVTACKTEYVWSVSMLYRYLQIYIQSWWVRRGRNQTY